MGDKHRLIYFAERIERMSASAQQGIQQHVTRPGRATSTNKRPGLHAMGPEAVLAQHVHFRISRTHVRREGAPAQALRPGRIQSSTRYPTTDLDPRPFRLGRHTSIRVRHFGHMTARCYSSRECPRTSHDAGWTTSHTLESQERGLTLRVPGPMPDNRL